jgi:hypothetical protein
MSQPELWFPEPFPGPCTHHSIDELPGTHPMPAPARWAELDRDDGSLVDDGTIEPAAQNRRNPGLASLYTVLATRGATMAGQVRRVSWGGLVGDPVSADSEPLPSGEKRNP